MTTPEFKALNEVYLLEGAKERAKKTLLNKVRVDEYTAETLSTIFKGAAVIIGNMILSYVERTRGGLTQYTNGDTYDISSVVRNLSASFNGISDFIVVGLNGDISDYKNATFEELADAAQAWHDGLEAGDSEVGYIEENEIIDDYRKADGTGFYWADLHTNNSPEECERMGHCGRASYGTTLFSLREFRNQGGYLVNESHLTAAVDRSDGKVTQLKGKKNQKPSSKYHEHIIKLIEKGVFQKFRSEYEPESDFELDDLTDNQLKQLYSNKPSVFAFRKDKKVLYNAGIIKSVPKLPYSLNIEYKDLGDFLNTSKRHTSIDYTISLLQGDIPDYIYDYVPSDADLFTNLYGDNQKSVSTVIEHTLGIDNWYDHFDNDFDEALEALSKIKYSEYEYIKHALRDSYIQVAESDLINKAESAVIDALSDLGRVTHHAQHRNPYFQVDITDVYTMFGESAADQYEDEYEEDIDEYPKEFIETAIYKELGDEFNYDELQVREYDSDYIVSDREFNRVFKELF